MRAFVLSSRLTDARRRALVVAVGEDVDLMTVPNDEPLPYLGSVDAVIIDGHPAARPAEELAGLAKWVEDGGSLLAIGAAPHGRDGFWAGLLGVTADTPHPVGEWFAKVSEASHHEHRHGASSHLTQRLDSEFPVVDRFEPLRLEEGAGAQVLVGVSISFLDHAAITERSVGAGRVVTSGFGITDQALLVPAVATLLRRALRPAGAAHCCGRVLGLGVVGYGPFGGMGYYHGTAARSTPGLEFVATCDPSADRRKAAEADFTGVRAYEHVDELAGDDDVEIAVIATPPAFHAELALRLLRAGKHVACEKPLCLTVAEADLLIATAAEHGRVLTVNQNRRWDPDFVAIRRAVAGGLLGEVFNIETFVGGYEHPCRAWHSEESVSGGAVYDWGSHHVDWILQLMGEPPITVQTIGHKRVWHDITNLDQLRVRLAFADGREAEFFQSDIAAVRRPKFYVQGTAGTLVGHYRPVTFERIEPGRGFVSETAHHAEAPAELTLARYESGYGLTETHLPVAPERRFAFHANLADHLHLGEPLAVTPESVRRVIAVLEAAHLSGADGGRTLALREGL